MELGAVESSLALVGPLHLIVLEALRRLFERICVSLATLSPVAISAPLGRRPARGAPGCSWSGCADYTFLITRLSLESVSSQPPPVII